MGCTFFSVVLKMEYHLGNSTKTVSQVLVRRDLHQKEKVIFRPRNHGIRIGKDKKTRPPALRTILADSQNPRDRGDISKVLVLMGACLKTYSNNPTKH